MQYRVSALIDFGHEPRVRVIAVRNEAVAVVAQTLPTHRYPNKLHIITR